MPHPARLDDLIVPALRRFDPQADSAALALWRSWPQLAGDAISQHAQPAWLRNGTLMITVDSSPWMQELHLMKERLRAQINAHIGTESVREILFEAGTPVRRADPEIAAPAVPEALLEATRVALPPMEPGELRNAFERILEARSQRRQSLARGRRRERR